MNKSVRSSINNNNNNSKSNSINNTTTQSKIRIEKCLLVVGISLKREWNGENWLAWCLISFTSAKNPERLRKWLPIHFSLKTCNFYTPNRSGILLAILLVCSRPPYTHTLTLTHYSQYCSQLKPISTKCFSLVHSTIYTFLLYSLCNSICCFCCFPLVSHSLNFPSEHLALVSGLLVAPLYCLESGHMRLGFFPIPTLSFFAVISFLLKYKPRVSWHCIKL